MLDTGDPAPDFYLPAGTDPAQEYMLSSAATQSPVVVAFVPSEGVPARALLSALADVDWASVTDGVAIYGVTADEATARRVGMDLPFPVLVDRQRYVAEKYGLAGSEGDQAVFVVDRRCTIRYAWHGSEGDPPIAAITEAVAAL